jgi:septal ring factor EnvC (AmiA/AmiB activator)
VAYAALILALALLAAAVMASPAAAEAELDMVRQKAAASAHSAQQHEAAIATLAHNIDLIGRDIAGRQRGLEESRGEQALLLGEIERVARQPLGSYVVAFADPIDRLRSQLLLEAVAPALRGEVRALTGEIERIAALRKELAAKQAELATAREALGRDRERLAQLGAHRAELEHRLLPAEPGAAAAIAKLGHEAKDVGDLVKRADAATERHDKELLAHARAGLTKAKAGALKMEAADPTRPHEVRPFDPLGDAAGSVITPPVAGSLSQGFGADAAAASQGLRFAASPAAVVAAPFDGRVVYAGAFGNLGLALIIRHAGLYHSLLAGLGHIDTSVDDWVVAGEPVGAMPDAAGATLYLELRREGRPVDPQPWLADRDVGRDATPNGKTGDQKVGE